MRPLCWQGWAVIVAFVASMVSGGVAFILLGLRDRVFLGITVFVLMAMVGAGQFLWAATTKSVSEPA